MTDCERRKCQYWVVDHCSDIEEFYNNGDLCCRYHLNAVARDYDKERLDRVEAMWQKYKDHDLEIQASPYRIINEFWQAIRREE